MSELERELGASLFVKQGRGVVLTKFGRVFLEHTQKSLDELELGKRRIAEMLNPDMGSIVISYASSMSFNFIPYIVSRFYEETGAGGIEFTFGSARHQRRCACFRREILTLVLVHGLAVRTWYFSRFIQKK